MAGAGSRFEVEPAALTSGAKPMRAAGDTVDTFGQSVQTAADGAATAVAMGPLDGVLEGFAAKVRSSAKTANESLDATARNLQANAARYRASDAKASTKVGGAYTPTRPSQSAAPSSAALTSAAGASAPSDTPSGAAPATAGTSSAASAAAPAAVPISAAGSSADLSSAPAVVAPEDFLAAASGQSSPTTAAASAAAVDPVPTGAAADQAAWTSAPAPGAPLAQVLEQLRAQQLTYDPQPAEFASAP